MPRPAACAHEVGGHHRLAVAGGERVERAPAERGEEQQQEHALAGGGVLEQPHEALAALGAALEGLAALGLRGHERALSGPHARSGPRGGRPGCPAGPPDSGAGRRSDRRSAPSCARPCPRRARPRSAFQPTRPGKVSSPEHHPPGGSDTRARSDSSSRVVLSPPAPAGNDRRGVPRGSSATRRPSTVSTRPRPTSSSLRAQDVAACHAALAGPWGSPPGRARSARRRGRRRRARAQVVDGEVPERVGAAPAPRPRAPSTSPSRIRARLIAAPPAPGAPGAARACRRRSARSAGHRRPLSRRPAAARRYRRGSGTADRASPASKRLLRPAQPGGRPAGPGERPAERVGGAHARGRCARRGGPAGPPRAGAPCCASNSTASASGAVPAAR